MTGECVTVELYALANVLIVIDMQNDFIDGSLGSSDACNIVDNICEKIKLYKEAGRPIYYTLDTHFNDYLDTLEGKYLPVPHCIKETHGWKLNTKINDLLEGYGKPVEKLSFGTTAWLTKDFLTDVGADIVSRDTLDTLTRRGGSIELCGLCTDICVVSNALILRTVFPNTTIKVDAKCCAGTTLDKHQAAIDIMDSCQIDVINTLEE